MTGGALYVKEQRQTEFKLRSALVTKCQYVAERYFPERRIFINSQNGLLQISLRTQTQITACFSVVVLLTWMLLVFFFTTVSCKVIFSNVNPGHPRVPLNEPSFSIFLCTPFVKYSNGAKYEL